MTDLIAIVMSDGPEALAWWILAAVAVQAHRLRQRVTQLEAGIADRDRALAAALAELALERARCDRLYAEMMGVRADAAAGHVPGGDTTS